MKKAIVVALSVSDVNGRKQQEASEKALAELNQHLADGWTVEYSFPMSGTANNFCSATVVILNKEG